MPTRRFNVHDLMNQYGKAPEVSQPEDDAVDALNEALKQRQAEKSEDKSSAVSEKPNVIKEQKPPVAAKKPKQERVKGEYVQLRDFPASLAALAQSEVGRVSMSKAVQAYLLIHTDVDLRDVSIPDPEVLELVKKYSRSNKTTTISDLYERVGSLERKMDVMLNLMREIELGVCYIIFDRAGYSRSHATEPSKMKIMDDKMLDMLDRLRVETKNMKNQEQYRHGRRME